MGFGGSAGDNGVVGDDSDACENNGTVPGVGMGRGGGGGGEEVAVPAGRLSAEEDTKAGVGV